MARWLLLIAIPVIVAATVRLDWEPVTETVTGEPLEASNIRYETQVLTKYGWVLYEDGIKRSPVISTGVPVGCYTIRMFAIRIDYGLRSAPSEEVYFCANEVYTPEPLPPDQIELNR